MLRSHHAEATIALRGAEPLVWSVAGRNLLWQPDPAAWPHTAPVLFPIVGWARGGNIRVDGIAYPIGVHGFASAQLFVCTEFTGASATLTCAETAETLAQFPFRFGLQARYTLDATSLNAHFTVTNPGDRDLPYALGFHPGFVWPLAGTGRDGHTIEFAEPERPEIPLITADGLFSSRSRPISLEGPRLRLSDSLMNDEALCFLNAKSRAVRYSAPDGTALDIALDGFPHMALWSLPPAPFISIEAWTGHGDPEGFSGDIRQKPSMRLLAPGAKSEHAMRLTYSA